MHESGPYERKMPKMTMLILQLGQLFSDSHGKFENRRWWNDNAGQDI